MAVAARLLLSGTGVTAAAEADTSTVTTSSDPHPDAAPTDAATGRLLISWDRVAEALDRKDVGEAQRLAGLMAPRQWQTALTPGATDPRNAAAALALLPSMIGAHAWLPHVGLFILNAQPAGADLARQAMRVAADLLDVQDPAALHTWEVAEGTVVDVCAALRWVAGEKARPLPLRLAALQALGRARAICPPPAPALAADPVPEVRRAAMALLPTVQPTRTVLLARMEDDAPAVAAAAAARLCREEAAGAPDELALRLARQLATEVAPEDGVDLLECLARSPLPEDRALLEALARKGSGPVRERARELVDAAGPR